MDNDTIALIMVALVVFEGLQVLIMNLTLRSIKAKLELVVPDGKPAAAILSETVFEFMKALNENKNGEAQQVGAFVRGCSLAAFEEIKGKIPMIGGGAQMDESLEKLARKNPWIGIALGAANTLGPVLQAKMNEKGGGNAPGKPSGRGNVGYG